MEKYFSLIIKLYFLFGLIFAIIFALYYRWGALSYFSPPFFVVAFTWPYQAIGFINDLLYFGLAGKPI